MGFLFFAILIIWLIYDGVVTIVASVIAEQQYEAYKRLRNEVENPMHKL